MENTLGSRLAKYRKLKGLSQEELAFKLDVSRQAVSKRERDEASPDTNNLIALAKIYGVSLDDLLYKDPEEVKTSNENNTEEEHDKIKRAKSSKEFVSISKEGIHVVDNEEEVHVSRNGIQVKSKDKNSLDEEMFNSWDEDRKNGGNIFREKNPRLWIIKNVLNGSGYLLITVIYLILGFTVPNGWSVYWTLYFIPDILNSTINCFIYKRASSFNITFLVTFIYLFVGMYLGIWHPTWLVFLAIPLFYIVVENIDKMLKVSAKNKEYKEKVVDSIEE